MQYTKGGGAAIRMKEFSPWAVRGQTDRESPGRNEVQPCVSAVLRSVSSQLPGSLRCGVGCSQISSAPPRWTLWRQNRAVTQSDSDRGSASRAAGRAAMPSNVEIKAKVSDPAEFAKKAAELSQSEGTIIRQHDTFFNCSQGRLKLRDFMNGAGQLIFYERPDTDGPKLSRYSISPTNDPQSLQTVLSDALGVKGEVVMRPEQTVEEGQQVAEGLMEQLGVSQQSLVTGAYMDLILKGQKET
ncbi:hypothetical protein INR49_019423 [Caranx melampygus]|nr:hypothetical protein INR49_019423 [Caranx melampygus]